MTCVVHHTHLQSQVGVVPLRVLEGGPASGVRVGVHLLLVLPWQLIALLIVACERNECNTAEYRWVLHFQGQATRREAPTHPSTHTIQEVGLLIDPVGAISSKPWGCGEPVAHAKALRSTCWAATPDLCVVCTAVPGKSNR